MQTSSDIGIKIKNIRTEKGYTLKQLSEETGFSIGYLSQFERGMTQIALDTLQKLCEVLEVEFQSLFQEEENRPSDISRSYEQTGTMISPQIIQYILSQNVTDFQFLPRIYELLPFANTLEEELELYEHEGEEFIYVLEGTLTVKVGDAEHVLNQGDSIQIHSSKQHNWMNRTHYVTKILAVNVPNPFVN